MTIGTDVQRNRLCSSLALFENWLKVEGYSELETHGELEWNQVSNLHDVDLSAGATDCEDDPLVPSSWTVPRIVETRPGGDRVSRAGLCSLPSFLAVEILEKGE